MLKEDMGAECKVLSHIATASGLPTLTTITVLSLTSSRSVLGHSPFFVGKLIDQLVLSGQTSASPVLD